MRSNSSCTIKSNNSGRSSLSLASIRIACAVGYLSHYVTKADGGVVGFRHTMPYRNGPSIPSTFINVVVFVPCCKQRPNSEMTLPSLDCLSVSVVSRSAKIASRSSVAHNLGWIIYMPSPLD